MFCGREAWSDARVTRGVTRGVSAPGPRVRPRVKVHPGVAAAAVQGHVTAVDQSGIK